MKLFSLLLLSLFLLSFISANIITNVEPVIKDESYWKVESTNLKDYEFIKPELILKTQEICITPKDSKSSAKPVCYTPKEEDKLITLETATKEKIVLNYIEESKYLYETSKLSIDDFSIEILFDEVKQDKEIYWYADKRLDYGVKFNANITNFVKSESITFRVNKLQEQECINTLFAKECIVKELSFKDFESLNEINNKTIKVIYDMDDSLWEQFKLFFFKIFGYNPESSYREVIGYDVTYYGNITDLDPTISITSVTSTNSFLQQTQAESEFSHLNISDTSLVAYYSFDVNGRDYSNNNNDGTLTGNAFVNTSSGKYGGALQLDGSGDYANTAYIPNNTAPFSYSSWVKLNADSLYFIIAQVAYTTPDREPAVTYDSSSNKLGCYLVKNSTTYYMGGVVSPNIWYHSVCQYNGTHLNSYINGNLEESMAVNLTYQSTGQLVLGARTGYAQYHFAGNLDEVMIFNRSLSETEIQQIYNSTYQRFYPEGNQTFKFNNVSLGNDTKINLTVEGQTINGTSLNATLWEANVGKNSGYLPYNSSGYLQLDGSGDYVDVPISRTNEIENRSISVWVKRMGNTTGTYGGIVTIRGFDSGANDYNHQLAIRTNDSSNSGIFCSSFISLPVEIGTRSISLPINEWAYISCNQDYNGSIINLSLYINGVLINSSSGLASTYQYSSGMTSFGVSKVTSNRYFNGSLDEVMIFNRTLSTEEIQNIYNLNKSYYNGSTSGLVSYYSFNTGSVQDDFGNNSGTSVGDAYIPSVRDADNSLVGYWHGDGNALDYSGRGYNGTLNGVANATSTGIFNQSFGFNGSDGYITISGFNKTVIGMQNDTAVSVWLNTRTISGFHDILSIKSGTSGASIILRTNNDELVAYRYNTSGTASISTTPAVNLVTNTWYHYLVNYNSTAYSLYLNGNLVLTNSSISGDLRTFDNIRIGEMYDASNQFWNGSLDELMVFNRSLSADEIKSLYVTGSTNHRDDNVGVGVNWTTTDGEKTLTIFNSTHYQYANYTVNSSSNYLLPDFKFDSNDYNFYTPVIKNVLMESYTEIGCTQNLQNTSWSEWIDVGCLGDDLNQSRFLVEYDANICGTYENVTHYEYQQLPPNFVNTSWNDWYFTDVCQITDLRPEERNLTQYDTQGCASNTTFYEYDNESCNYCSYSTAYTDWTAWSDIGCIDQTDMNQSRERTQYDENYDSCYAVTGLPSDLWNGGVNITETEYQSVEDETCDTLNPTFTNCRNLNGNINTAFSQSITATDANGIDTYWLNDTSDFAVSSLGLITNNTLMNMITTYNLLIFANDTRGREANCSFSIGITMPSTTTTTISKNPKYCPKGGKYCDCSIYGSC
jgi:hypothetical protein